VHWPVPAPKAPRVAHARPSRPDPAPAATGFQRIPRRHRFCRPLGMAGKDRSIAFGGFVRHDFDAVKQIAQS